MLEKEIDIIANKDNLLCEVNNIIEYLDKTTDCSERDTDRGRLLDLQVDYIGNKLQYAYKEEYKIPKIFSSFALTYLFNFTNDDQSLNRPKAIKNIFLVLVIISDKLLYMVFQLEIITKLRAKMFIIIKILFLIIILV